MIKRQQPAEINGSGSGSGATQTEIYQIFEGTNPQGFADSLFFPYLDAGNLGIAAYLNLIRAKLNSQATSDFQASIYNTLVDTNPGSGETIANLIYELNNANNSARQPEIIRTSTNGTIPHQPHNISFANIGNANASLTINGTTVILESGLTVNYDAGGNNNKFNSGSFVYDATGTILLINYVR